MQIDPAIAEATTVSSSPLNTRQEIKERLHALASRVELIIPPSEAIRAPGAHLRDLGDAVAGGPTADAWASNDPFRLIDPTSITEFARQSASNDRFLSTLETFRNALVLSPLLVTWLGIAFATNAYQRLLAEATVREEYVRLVETPFLYLWERGFEGRLPGLPLSALALIDGVLIGVVFLLTLVAHGRANWLQRKKTQEAEMLHLELNDALTDATLALSTRRWQEPSNFVERFDATASRLLKEIEQERDRLDRLTTQRESELQNLSSFTPQLIQSTQNMLGAAQAIQQTQSTNAQSLLAAVQKMEQVHAAGTQHVLAATQELRQAHTEGTEHILHATHVMRQTQQELTASVGEAQQQVAESIQALAAPVQEMTNQQQALISEARSAANRLGAFSNEYANQGQRLHELIQGLQSALAAVNMAVAQTAEVASELGAITSQASNAQAGFLEAVAGEREAQRDLARMVSRSTVELERAVGEVSDVGRALHGIAVDVSDLARVLTPARSTIDVR